MIPPGDLAYLESLLTEYRRMAETLDQLDEQLRASGPGGEAALARGPAARKLASVRSAHTNYDEAHRRLIRDQQRAVRDLDAAKAKLLEYARHGRR